MRQVQGTVVAADFSSDEETLITISVPVDTRWGYEAVTIICHDVPARAALSEERAGE